MFKTMNFYMCLAQPLMSETNKYYLMRNVSKKAPFPPAR